MARENLSSSEYTAIGQAVMDMVSSYPDAPENITYDYQSINGVNHIGVITTPGGRYLKRDVTGGFEAQLPFDIVYRCAATENIQLLNAEKLLDGIADYLENMSYPSLTDGRAILKITMNSITYRTQADQSGAVQFLRSGSLRYEKE